MNISNDIKCKVFALYLEQKINENNSTFYDTMVSVDLFNESIHTSNHITYKLDEVKLVLKPLSSITDEHIVWVHDTVHNFHEQRKLRPDWAKNVTPPFKDLKDMISNGLAHYKGGYLSDSAVHQYLISKGYDVPLMLLGWKNLEQSGLAIYEEELTTKKTN